MTRVMPNMPTDFEAALRSIGLLAAFKALAPSHRRERIQAIENAKKPETRQRRIEKAVEMIRG